MLKNISFNVRQGSITGIIGSDEEVKLHLVRAINGELKQTTGKIYIKGQMMVNRDSCPMNIRMVIKDTLFIPFLSAENNIKLYSMLRKCHQKSVTEVLEICGLKEFKNVAVGKFTKGMKRKLTIAESLLNDPELVILYERDKHLNTKEVQELKKVLLNLKNIDKTVIVTSSEYGNVASVCNSLCELDDGVLDVIYE